VNGSGKSTTLRIMVGLSRPDQGNCLFYGHKHSDLGNPPRLVGVMLDASANHPGRSGWSHLRAAAMIAGVTDFNPGDALEEVGLAQAGRKLFTNYSLGMKQRLGIALALVAKPSILILDEPANGLDPHGIHWMRGFLAQFSNSGGTVLLSSHNLAEVEKLATRIVIIDGGKKILERDIEVDENSWTRVTVTDPVGLKKFLECTTHSFRMDGNQFCLLGDPVSIGLLLLENKFAVTSMAPTSDRISLEETFMNMTSVGVINEWGRVSAEAAFESVNPSRNL
jgi:ABC-2 type transport system ATP-binding protein